MLHQHRDTSSIILRPAHTVVDATVGNDRWSRAKTALVVGYVLLLPVQLPLGADRRLAISDLFILAYLLIASFRLRRLREAWTCWYGAIVAVMGMGLLVSLLWTGTVSQFAITQKALGLAFLLVTMACLTDFMSSIARVRWMLDLFIVAVTVNAAIALGALAAQQSDPARFGAINYLGVRLSGFTIDPNAFGGFIASALMLHLYAGRSNPFRLRAPIGHMITAVLGIGLVLTYSRSAWIGAVLGSIVAVMTAGASARRAALPVVLALSVSVPILAINYLPNLTQLSSRQDQVEDRFEIINTSLSEFSQSPVFGIGLGNFEIRHGVIIHNTLLWFLCELGIVGFLVIVGFLSSFAARMVRLAREQIAEVRAVALSLLAAHAAMIGLSTGIEALYQRQWWLLFATGAALHAMSVVDRR